MYIALFWVGGGTAGETFVIGTGGGAPADMCVTP